MKLGFATVRIAARVAFVSATIMPALHGAISDVAVQSSTGGNCAYHSYILHEGTLLDAVNFGHGVGSGWGNWTVNSINGVPFVGTGSEGPGCWLDSSFGNPARAGWAIGGCPHVDDGLDHPGIDDVFFSEVWGDGADKRLSYDHLDPQKSYWIQFLHGEPRAMSAWFDDIWLWTDVDAPIRLPGFSLGNGIAGENPPGPGDAVVVTARITGVSSFFYSVNPGQGRGPSIAGFQIREIATATGSRNEEFDGASWAGWWRLDLPDQGIVPALPRCGDGWLHMDTAWPCNMWNERAGAPILWTTAPSGAFEVETSVTLESLACNQVAGLVLYDGPDGANGIHTYGIYTWGGHRWACFERVGDGTQTIASPELALVDHAPLDLLLRVTPGHWLGLGPTSPPKTYLDLYYRLSDSGLWTPLGTYAAERCPSRVGLFLKADSPSQASFDYFRLTDGSAPAPVSPPAPVEVPPGSVTKSCGAGGLPDGQHDQVFVEDVKDAVGAIQLDAVTVTGGRISAVGGGVLMYQGVLADLLGDVFQIESGQEDGEGLRLTVTFRMPPLLGGSNAQLQFLVTPDCVLTLQGAHIEIPGKIRKEAFTIERAYLDVLPAEGKFGGGGLFGVDHLEKTFGGWIDFRSGIGPVVNGRATFDVTKLGGGAGSLAIPIGDTGAFLEYVGAIVRNDNGLSDPYNWDQSNLTGEFEVVLGRPIEIGGQEVFAYKFEGQGTWNIHDGSYDFTGEGKLFGKIPTAGVEMHYAPPASITVAGDFDAGVYHGRMTLHQSGGSLSGALHGDLSIPDSVPVIGGKSLGGVDATLDGTRFTGSARVPLTPGVPEFCLPEVCVPVPPCFSAWYCNDRCCAWVCWPCGCGWHDVCGPTVCTPGVCTPAIPGTHADFSFSYDLASGAFEFGTPDVGLDAGLAAVGSGRLESRLFRNWAPLACVETVPGRRGIELKGGPPTVTKTFAVGDAAPALFFRTVFGTNASPTQVAMSVRTPAGLILDSAHGALPLGYAEHLGFSRFHPEAQEQVILLAHPVPGEYEVTVVEDPELGPFAIEAHVNDAAPTGRITGIEASPGAGQCTVAWEDHDIESTNTVRIYLDPDRGGHDGFLAGRVDAADNVGRLTIDTAALKVAPGPYFVSLVIEDGVNPPVFCRSDDTIEVCPEGAPEPVSDVRFLPGNGSFRIGWRASGTAGVRGYRVEWTEAHEDLTRMHAFAWVAGRGQTEYVREIGGLANGVPLLVQVVAVDEEGHRSLPSSPIRLTPRAVGQQHAPRFVSEPDTDATAGYGYVYRPMIEDVDGAEGCVFRLVYGPTNMTVDAASGLVRWTPAVELVGSQAVRLEVEELSQGQGTGVHATQSYTVYVHPPENLNGLEPHPYSFLSHPRHDTVEGELYTYQAVVIGPDQDVRYALLAGPEGMTVDAGSGLVTWAVPPGARGAWVRLEAVVGEEHELEQDYYLYVFSEKQLLPSLQLVALTSAPGQVELGLGGYPDRTWTIQSSTNLVEWRDSATVALTNGTARIAIPTAGASPVQYFRGIERRNRVPSE